MQDKLPYNVEQERAILGSILLKPETMDQVSEQLKPDHFFVYSHREVYKALNDLYKSDRVTDLASLFDYYQFDQDKLAKIGGQAFLASLLDGAMRFDAHGVAATVKSLEDIYINRQLAFISVKFKELSEDVSLTGAELIEKAEQLLAKLRVNKSQAYEQIGSIVLKRLAEIEKISSGAGTVNVVSSGFKDLDFFIGGFRPGQFGIIAARPGAGKTSLALAIAMNASAAGYKVPFFSLEMTPSELADRALSMSTGIDANRFRNGFLSRQEWEALSSAANQMHQYPLFIDSKAGLTVQSFRSTLRRIKSEQGLSMAILDYLQLVKGEKGKSRYEIVSDISREMKEIAMEMEIPIIALSQLSRKLEDREDHKPKMSDLRESGNLEQDADLIMLLHRPEKYSKAEEDKGVVECIIDKQRAGRTGSFKFGFIAECTKFYDFEVA